MEVQLKTTIAVLTMLIFAAAPAWAVLGESVDSVRADLLGSYYSEFHQAVAGRRHRGPVVVKTKDLVVESGGHLRAFYGRAYVTSLVPNTLSPAVVQ